MTLAQVAVWLLAVGPGVSFAPTGQAERSVSHLRAERGSDIFARARAGARRRRPCAEVVGLDAGRYANVLAAPGVRPSRRRRASAPRGADRASGSARITHAC